LDGDVEANVVNLRGRGGEAKLVKFQMIVGFKLMRNEVLPFTGLSCSITQSCTFSTRKSLDILGLKDKASAREIKNAYLQLSKEFHPDRNTKVDAVEKFQQIQEAYDSLLKEQTRNKGACEGTHTESAYKEYSDDYKQWKRRTEKKNILDEWLRKVQRESREHKEKLKEKEAHDEEVLRKFNSFQENNFFSRQQTNHLHRVSGLSEDYLKFEKWFVETLDNFSMQYTSKTPKSSKTINDWASIYDKKSFSNPMNESFLMKFISWYIRWVLSKAPKVLFPIALTLLG